MVARAAAIAGMALLAVTMAGCPQMLSDWNGIDAGSGASTGSSGSSGGSGTASGSGTSSGATDAGETSTPEAEASDAVPVEAALVCSPLRAKLSDVCPIVGFTKQFGAEPPGYAWLVASTFPPPDGCAVSFNAGDPPPVCQNGCNTASGVNVVDTFLAPPECQCAETFNCACLWASPSFGFQSYPCEMVAGEPVISNVSRADAPDGSLPL